MSALAKRVLDVVLASAALIVLAPVLAAVAVAVRLTSPGPALFRQERLGLHRRPFVMLKFRSMTAGAADTVHRDYVRRMLAAGTVSAAPDGGLHKLTADPRVTPLGRWLRRTSVDELPQLLNIVRGEMSLVGPRPVLAWEAELFGPEAMARFGTRPGLTGLWQVSGRSRLTMPQALALDVEYVRRQSFWLDLTILARTVPAQLRRNAA